MTEADVRTFLKRFAAEDLASRGILNGKTLLLNNKSVAPLTEFMNEHGLSRLVAAARGWSLDVNGEFRNPRSTEATSGNVERLKNPGNVFNEQNTSINPHYARGQEPDKENADEFTFALERDLQKALRENIGQFDPALKIVDDGNERRGAAGRIDITAEAPDGGTGGDRAQGWQGRLARDWADPLVHGHRQLRPEPPCARHPGRERLRPARGHGCAGRTEPVAQRRIRSSSRSANRKAQPRPRPTQESVVGGED